MKSANEDGKKNDLIIAMIKFYAAKLMDFLLLFICHDTCNKNPLNAKPQT